MAATIIQSEKLAIDIGDQYLLTPIVKDLNPPTGTSSTPAIFSKQNPNRKDEVTVDK